MFTQDLEMEKFESTMCYICKIEMMRNIINLNCERHGLISCQMQKISNHGFGTLAVLMDYEGNIEYGYFAILNNALLIS